MDAKIKAAATAFESFKTAFRSNDVAKCSSILSQLKIQLTEFPALPPLYQQTPTAEKELLLAREILEYAVVLSVKLKDEASFERHFLQLKSYYTDTRKLLPLSKQEQLILGLNLLRLLVQNRIAEFHTEMELTDPKVHNDPYIKHAIELEQSLMEGAYNRVLESRGRLPDESYAYFMDLLIITVRDEIAGCSEKAYDFLTAQDAKKMLKLSSDQELKEYAAERKWELKDGCVYFREVQEHSISKDIPSLQLIQQTLGYARELERIV